MAKHVPD